MRKAEQAPSQAQVDQAIEWLVKLRFDRPGPAIEAQFNHWLAADALNALAWQRVSGLNDELAELPSTLSRHTLERHRRLRVSRRAHLKLLAVLAVGGSLGGAAREPLGVAALMADSSTTTGARRRLQGSDGSRIELNTASAIDLRYSPVQRELTLVRGEVSLDSASGDPRPFRIHTRLGELATADAQLLLRENDRGLLLAVRAGEVTLFPASPKQQQVHAGERLQVLSNGDYQPAHWHGDPWGWTDGVLSVQQMPLGEFVAELARYRPGVLRCSPEVAALKVSGTYQLDDPERILHLLARSLPLRVSYRTRYWVTIGAA